MNIKKLTELPIRFKAYLKRLLFPIYFFPLKLVTYSTYYLLRFLLLMMMYPFRSWRNFFRSLFYILLGLYILFSLLVIADYIITRYGRLSKLWCDVGLNTKLKHSVVRVVGGYSEGTGFFISDDQILTNFHVIAGEPTPKIIFPDGSFTTATQMIGNQSADLALITIGQKHPQMVLPLLTPTGFGENEPVISAGYPLGTSLTGEATVMRGNFINYRHSRQYPAVYIQTSITLAPGMSGGPLVEGCGKVVGINTQGLAGQSFFIDIGWALDQRGSFTDQDITKLKLDPAASPQKAVEAFYTYLKARDMESGFKLLSRKYLEKTNFSEWTNRFTDILDVQVFKTEPVVGSHDTAFIDFATKNWVQGEVEIRYYQGTWQTVFEDGVYKMLKSNIKEVSSPDDNWL